MGVGAWQWRESMDRASEEMGPCGGWQKSSVAEDHHHARKMSSRRCDRCHREMGGSAFESTNHGKMREEKGLKLTGEIKMTAFESCWCSWRTILC